MDNVKQQVVDRLKQASNILVTVRTNPTIDLLSACIGLALVLDKMEKHATAVFSGEVPSAMEFLKPEETIEQTPNSLRDFIIALDKSKADKLRYKVEDKVVRIFITPYKTSLTKDDLEFSQGDFNIDVVVALGVHEQTELDSAITEHGRILHDATVISINNTPNGNLGSLSWQEISASSVSEMVADLAVTIDKSILDEQVATALLTGVVAETARFSNDKTTPKTMNLAGELMAAGANQQLVADKLRGETHDVPHDNEPAEAKAAGDDGTLEITHVDAAPSEEPKPTEPEEPATDQAGEPSNAEAELEPMQTNKREMLPVPELGNAPAGQEGTLVDNPFTGEFKDEETSEAQHGFLIDQAAEIAGGATGSTESPTKPAGLDLPPVVPPETPILTHDQPLLAPLPDDTSAPTSSPAPEPAELQPADSPTSVVPSITPPLPSMPAALPTDDNGGNQTLEDIEESVHSPHMADADDGVQVAPAAPSDADRIDEARAQVEAALKQIAQPPKPIESLGAQPLGGPLHTDAAPAPAAPVPAQTPSQIEVDEQGNIRPFGPQVSPTDPMTPQAMDMPLPPVAPSGPMPQTPPSQSAGSTSPPAVPPPFMPPFGPPPA